MDIGALAHCLVDQILHPPPHTFMDAVVPTDLLGDPADVVSLIDIQALLHVHDLEINAQNGFPSVIV